MFKGSFIINWYLFGLGRGLGMRFFWGFFIKLNICLFFIVIRLVIYIVNISL